MKSDSERQTAYQKRRAEKEVRVTFWMGKDVEEMCEKLHCINVYWAVQRRILLKILCLCILFCMMLFADLSLLPEE